MLVSLMLICAVAMSLALGVLAAYFLCMALFRVFRWHSIAAAQDRVAASPRIAIES